MYWSDKRESTLVLRWDVNQTVNLTPDCMQTFIIISEIITQMHEYTLIWSPLSLILRDYTSWSKLEKDDIIHLYILVIPY